jgi:hypothetical protein
VDLFLNSSGIMRYLTYREELGVLSQQKEVQ